MKKYLLLFLIGLFFIGCVNDKAVEEVIEMNESEFYHEVQTNLTDKDINDFNPEKITLSEMEELKNKDVIFWYDQDKKIEAEKFMYFLTKEIECDNKKSNCTITGLSMKGKEISESLFPKDLIDSLEEVHGFYYDNENVYTIGIIEDINEYNVFKNNEKLFSRNMFSETGNIISKASIVLDSPAFNFNEKDGSNIWYNNEFLNEKYDLDASSYLFGYNNKIGFVGEKDDKKFIIFDGEKVSQDFDEIRTNTCCAVTPYPINIDANGILFFLGKREEKYFISEVDLNNYTK